MSWFKSKKEISPLLRGLVKLKVGKRYGDTKWCIDIRGNLSYNDEFMFEIYEVKRYENLQSEIKILSAKDGKLVDFDAETSYILSSKSISWLMYDTEKLFEEYEKLKVNKVGINSDFHKSLEEFKSVKV